MQKVRFWDPEHWRFRAEETRTVADQMTHGRSCGALPWTTTASLSLPRSNSSRKRLNEKLRKRLLTPCPYQAWPRLSVVCDSPLVVVQVQTCLSRQRGGLEVGEREPLGGLWDGWLGCRPWLWLP